MQDVAFGKTNAKTEASQLRESIKIVDEKMQQLIENKIKQERDNELLLSKLTSEHQTELDTRQNKMEKLLKESKEVTL